MDRLGLEPRILFHRVLQVLNSLWYTGCVDIDLIDKNNMLPLCYQMASVHRRKDSKYWYCTFRIPVPDKDSGEVSLKQFQRNTKQLEKKKAERAADEIERATREELGTGDEKSAKLLQIVTEATQEAVRGTLSEPMARKCLMEIYAIANGSEILTYSTRAWFDEWLARKNRTVKPATYALYRLAVDTFATWLGDRADNRIEAVSSQDIRRWRDQLHDEGRTGKTVGQYQKSVSSAFRAAVSEGVLLRNPAEGLDFLPKEDSVKRIPFSADEIKALIAHSDPQWALAIQIGYYTGLRLRDIANLKWADVDLLNGGVILVEPMKQPRKKEHKKQLEVPVHPALLNVFTEYPSSDDGKSFVFPNLAKRPTGGRGGLSSSFTDLMSAAGVDPMVKRTRKKGQAGRKVSAKGFHSLRHSFVSALANTGVDAELRHELTGHDDADSHKIYTHLDRERLKGAMSSLPSLADSDDGKV